MMIENSVWAVKTKTENAVMLGAGGDYDLGEYNDRYKALQRQDYALANRLERNPFSLKVDSCVCSSIKGEFFIDRGILQKDVLDIGDVLKIAQCKGAAKKDNVVALFDYGLYMISRAKSHSNLNDAVKIEQGLFLLKAAARLGHCKAIYAFCDYLMSYTLIDTGLVESWIEIYLGINPCMRKELEMLGR